MCPMFRTSCAMFVEFVAFPHPRVPLVNGGRKAASKFSARTTERVGMDAPTESERGQSFIEEQVNSLSAYSSCFCSFDTTQKPGFYFSHLEPWRRLEQRDFVISCSGVFVLIKQTKHCKSAPNLNAQLFLRRKLPNNFSETTNYHEKSGPESELDLSLSALRKFTAGKHHTTLPPSSLVWSVIVQQDDVMYLGLCFRVPPTALTVLWRSWLPQLGKCQNNPHPLHKYFATKATNNCNNRPKWGEKNSWASENDLPNAKVQQTPSNSTFGVAEIAGQRTRCPL